MPAPMTMPTVIAMTSADRNSRRGAEAASRIGESIGAACVSACWR